MASEPRQSHRGQIIARGEKKWLVRVYLGRVAGKKKYASKTVSGSRRAAEQEITQLLRATDTRTFIEPSKLTVEEYLLAWLASKKDVGPKTRMDYEDRLKKDVIPFIGSLRLSQMHRQAVRELYASLEEKRGIAPITIRHTHRVLRQAFAQAVDDGLIFKSPCDGAQAAIPQGTKREMDFLTPEETRVLLTANRRSPWYPLWCLMVNTGMRPQEALALKWDDLVDDTLAVRRALVQVERRGRWEPRGDMKTDSSKRCVILSESVLEALREHRKAQAVWMLKAGENYRREGFIFANELGGFLDISKARRLWKAALRAAGLRSLSFYEGTRHTHASHLLSGGVDAKTAAARLGHANPTMLLTVYAHVIPQARRDAASVLDRLIAKQA
jgi:integrase